jgi:hypothetical protein
MYVAQYWVREMAQANRQIRVGITAGESANPQKAVPATTKVFATPLIESANAPGSCQYSNPMARGPIPEMYVAQYWGREMAQANSQIRVGITAGESANPQNLDRVQ